MYPEANGMGPRVWGDAAFFSGMLLGVLSFFGEIFCVVGYRMLLLEESFLLFSAVVQKPAG